MFLAIIFIVLGIFVLLNALGIIIGANSWGIIWALVLIAIGFRLLVKRHRICPICGWGHFHEKIHEKMHGRCQCECGHGHDGCEKDGQEEHH